MHTSTSKDFNWTLSSEAVQREAQADKVVETACELDSVTKARQSLSKHIHSKTIVD